MHHSLHTHYAFVCVCVALAALIHPFIHRLIYEHICLLWAIAGVHLMRLFRITESIFAVINKEESLKSDSPSPVRQYEY